MSTKPLHIMFVDDDVVTCNVMKRNCDTLKINCDVFTEAAQCLEKFTETGADIVITDLRMPGMTGFELLSELRNVDMDTPILVMTGYSSVDNAVEAMKRGATDFIKKPFDFSELRLMIERALKSAQLKNENQLLKKRLSHKRNRFGMIGDTGPMKSLFSTIEKVAEVSCSVIITGESGTGKELVARALHDYSPRKEAPFVAIDCGALTETLLESELFGHEKGSFTGATQRKRGLMEQASGGTLFLDEICNISDSMQMKLMRALESSTIMRVGGTTSIPVDVRVVAATNRELEPLVDDGTLRHDFYHRLSVVTIHVPALRERREDIPALIEMYVEEFAERYSRRIQGYDSVSLKRICEAEWKGNVRELRNVVERSVILADGPKLAWQDYDMDYEDEEVNPMQFSDDRFISLIELEHEYINHVLKCCSGKKTQAAKVLGIDKTTLWRKLRRYESEEERV